MRLFRSASLRAADAAAASMGVPSTELMLRAGLAVAEAALEGWPLARRVLIACGPGNNGGDGFVAAQALAAAGRLVTIAELRPGASKGDAAWARRRLLDSGTEVAWSGEGGSRELPTDGHHLVIDALFGTGLTRALEGTAASWVKEMAACGLPVVAVDVPSGVDADRAVPPGTCVRAALTLQLAGAVPAALLAPARTSFGVSRVVDIGIPEEVLEAHAEARAVDEDWLRVHGPRRDDDANKYSVGTVLVVGGSRRYAGATELSARAAYRAGAGLVTLVSEERAPSAWPEVVWEPREPSESVSESVRRVLDAPGGTRRARAALVGPGLEADAQEVSAVLESIRAPVVLDAGALLPEVRDAARQHGKTVLTPHAGEAQRLLDALGAGATGLGGDASGPDGGARAPDAKSDPVSAALSLARAWNAVCVLKGPGSVIADPHGRWTISSSGTPALATGGSGDVLAGIIAAFLASTTIDASQPTRSRDTGRDGRSATPVDGDLWASSAAAVHLHGIAGACAAERGPGVVAGDVVEALPAARAGGS